MRIAEVVKRLIQDERGAEAVEYAVIIGLLAVTSISTIAVVGHAAVGKFQDLLAAVGCGDKTSLSQTVDSAVAQDSAQPTRLWSSPVVGHPYAPSAFGQPGGAGSRRHVGAVIPGKTNKNKAHKEDRANGESPAD